LFLSLRRRAEADEGKSMLPGHQLICFASLANEWLGLVPLVAPLNGKPSAWGHELSTNDATLIEGRGENVSPGTWHFYRGPSPPGLEKTLPQMADY